MFFVMLTDRIAVVVPTLFGRISVMPGDDDLFPAFSKQLCTPDLTMARRAG
jgi:hypothetical protein